MEFENLPDGWKYHALENYIDIQSGYAFKSGDFQDNGVPVIKIKNITPPIISLDDVQYVSSEILNNKTQFNVHHKDILISMTGSNVNQMNSAVGKVSRLQYQGDFLLNQRVGKFVLTNSKEMDYNFLYYLVSTYDTQYELASNASGSANQANINSSMIKSLKRPIPPLPQQQKIASILSALDDKIELNNQMNQTLETMATALFKSWFVDFDPFQDGEFEDGEFGMIPKGWKVGIVGDFGNVITGKTPSTSNEDNYGAEYPFITIPDMHGQTYIIKTARSLSEIGHNVQSNKLIPKNSVLVSCIATVGLVSINARDSHTNQQINSIKCNTAKLPYVYLVAPEKPNTSLF